MPSFHRNPRYRTIAFYIAAVCVIATLGVLLILRFQDILSGLRAILSSLSPVLYGCIFAYFCLPLLHFFENRLLREWRMKKIRAAQAVLNSDAERPEKLRARRTVHVCRTQRRMLSIGLTYFSLLIVVGVFCLLIVPQIVTEYGQLSGKIADYVANAITWVQNVFQRFVGNFEADSATTLLQSFLSAALSSIAGVASGLIMTPYRIILGLVVSYYILLRKERLLRHLKRFSAAVLPRRRLPQVVEVARNADHTFGRYLIGKVFEALIVGGLFMAILAIFRFPYFSLVGLIMMITNLIPVFGVYIGCVPCAVLILIENPWMALWFLVITFIITQLDGAVIGPKVIGTAIGLDGLWIILSITVMGAFFGIPGMIFGAPIFSVLYSVIRSYINHRLVKKGLAEDSPEYAAMFSSEKILPTRQTRRALSAISRKHRFTEEDSSGKEEE